MDCGRSPRGCLLPLCWKSVNVPNIDFVWCPVGFDYFDLLVYFRPFALKWVGIAGGGGVNQCVVIVGYQGCLMCVLVTFASWPFQIKGEGRRIGMGNRKRGRNS